MCQDRPTQGSAISLKDVVEWHILGPSLFNEPGNMTIRHTEDSPTCALSAISAT